MYVWFGTLYYSMVRTVWYVCVLTIWCGLRHRVVRHETDPSAAVWVDTVLALQVYYIAVLTNDIHLCTDGIHSIKFLEEPFLGQKRTQVLDNAELQSSDIVTASHTTDINFKLHQICLVYLSVRRVIFVNWYISPCLAHDTLVLL